MLTGIRVLDLSRVVPFPFATAVLADLGLGYLSLDRTTTTGALKRLEARGSGARSVTSSSVKVASCCSSSPTSTISGL